MALREGCPRARVRSAIRGLIEGGILEYSYCFGQSYLVASFHHPVDIGARLTIVPPGYRNGIAAHRQAIVIGPGISFGCGRHPTTRLALQILEEGWDLLSARLPQEPISVIDIGTGSGILAIAAVCLGAASVLALDTDACARSEARANVRLNPKATRITVSDRLPRRIAKPLHLVLANLRLPTLNRLAPWMRAHLARPGYVIVSGFRAEEEKRLQTVYTENGFRSIGQRRYAGWSAMLLDRPKG
ncbi:MAG: 50S ribosomal protein L11 methyltransferase [Desulfobacterales bacterium]